MVVRIPVRAALEVEITCASNELMFSGFLDSLGLITNQCGASREMAFMKHPEREPFGRKVAKHSCPSHGPPRHPDAPVRLRGNDIRLSDMRRTQNTCTQVFT